MHSLFPIRNNPLDVFFSLVSQEMSFVVIASLSYYCVLCTCEFQCMDEYKYHIIYIYSCIHVSVCVFELISLLLDFYIFRSQFTLEL